MSVVLLRGSSAASGVLDPGHRTSIIDPAAGTGGFLAAALNQVFGGLDEKNIGPARRAEAKPSLPTYVTQRASR